MSSSMQFLATLLVLGAAAAGARGSDGSQAGPAEPKPWTILIYGAADNNADGPIFEWLGDVRRAVADDPALNVVLFVDRSTGFSAAKEPGGEEFTNNRLYLIHEKTAQRLDNGAEFPEMKLDRECEPDSADPATLRKFLRFGKAHHPAQHVALIIYSHASGISMCPDVESGRDMGIAELTEATEEQDGVEVAALELCNMGGIEIAYQWRPRNGGFSAEVLVAIPNANPPLDWERIFGRIHAPGSAAAKGRANCVDPKTMEARDFGRIAVEEGGAGRLAALANHPHPSPELLARVARESVAAYDLNAVEAVKKAVDELAVALWRTNAKEPFCALRGSKTTGFMMNYVGDNLDGERPFVNLYDLLRRAAECKELDETVHAKAKTAMAATEAVMIGSFGMSGYAGFEAGKNGVFIVFPRGDTPRPATLGGQTRAWGSFRWYSPEPAKEGKTVNGNLAWCRDGAIAGDGKVENWFELLDAWFDVDDGAAGGLNGWRW